MHTEQWHVCTFVSKKEMLLKYLTLEIGPGRPHFTKAKMHPIAPESCCLALPVTTAMQRQNPLKQAISLLCLHTSFILHIAAVA